MFQRKLLIVFVSLSLFLNFFCGCTMQNSPDGEVEKYCIHMLRDGSVYNKLLKDFASQNKAKKGISLTDAQIKRLVTACVDRMKKCDIQTKIISYDSNNAKVEVTVDHVNLSIINKDRSLENRFEQRARNVDSYEKRQDIMTDILVDFIKDTKAEGKKTFTVECSHDKTKKIWIINQPDKVMNLFISCTLQGVRL